MGRRLWFVCNGRIDSHFYDGNQVAARISRPPMNVLNKEIAPNQSLAAKPVGGMVVNAAACEVSSCLVGPLVDRELIVSKVEVAVQDDAV